jgi:hypothetical protein
MTPKTPVIAKAKAIGLTDITPRGTTLEFTVDPGGAFEFKNKSKHFSHFEITFDDPGPPGTPKTINGTAADSIFVQMPHATRTFSGTIVFKKDDGTAQVEVPFLAKSFPGGG